MSGPGIVIVGSGHAAKLHTKLLSKNHGDVRLGHWGRNSEATRALAAGSSGHHFAGDWTDALSESWVDAVFITTPPDTHADMAVHTLEAGKSVIVEKPAFLDLAEFDRVEAAAKAGGGRVLVAENYFYKPLLKRILAILESGELGQIRMMSFNAAKLQTVEGWRSDPAISGGGALFEGGIHWVSFMGSLGMEITHFSASYPDAPPGHERSAVFTAKYEGGAVGVLTYSWEIPSAFQGLRLSRIYGTRKSLLFESNGLFLLRGGLRPRLWFPGFSDIQGYQAMLADFVDALRTDREPEFTLADARRDVELIRRTYEAPDELLHR